MNDALSIGQTFQWIWSSSYCSQLHFIDSDEALDARPGRASLTGVQFAAEVKERENDKSPLEKILIYRPPMAAGDTIHHNH